MMRLACPASNGHASPPVVVDPETDRWTGESESEVRGRAAHEVGEIERRRHVYLGDSLRSDLAGRTVVPVIVKLPA